MATVRRRSGSVDLNRETPGAPGTRGPQNSDLTDPGNVAGSPAFGGSGRPLMGPGSTTGDAIRDQYAPGMGPDIEDQYEHNFGGDDSGFNDMPEQPRVTPAEDNDSAPPPPPPPTYYTLSEELLSALDEYGIGPDGLAEPTGSWRPSSQMSDGREVEAARQEDIDFGLRMLDRQMAGLTGGTGESNALGELGFQDYRDLISNNGFRQGTEAELGDAPRFESEDALRNALYATYDQNAQYGGGTPVWEEVRDAYTDYANPMLKENTAEQRDQLATALYAQGIGESRAGMDRYADLREGYGDARQSITDRAAELADQRENEVANLRTQMENMLYEGTSPNDMLTQMQQQQADLSSNPTFDYAAPTFQNLTAGLGAGYQGNQRYQDQQRFDEIYGRRGPQPLDPAATSGRVIQNPLARR